MHAKTPQNSFANLDPHISNILANAVRALHEPSINSSVAPLIPDLVASLNITRPHVRGCLEAALWLLADDLPTAHTLCQDIPTAQGSAWHAVLHRREGDFSNSKYWWRRAPEIAWQSPGSPPLHEQLHALLADAPPQLAAWRTSLARRYNPSDFVDVVASLHAHPDPAVTDLLVQAQRLEWAALYLECLQLT